MSCGQVQLHAGAVAGDAHKHWLLRKGEGVGVGRPILPGPGVGPGGEPAVALAERRPLAGYGAFFAFRRVLKKRFCGKSVGQGRPPQGVPEKGGQLSQEEAAPWWVGTPKTANSVRAIPVRTKGPGILSILPRMGLFVI